MVKIKFEITEDGKTLILNVQGHAGAAEKGKDIVCASCSFVAYMVAQNVTDMFNADELKKKPTIKLDEGDATITCKPKKDKFGKALYLFAICQRGFEILEATYPEYVKLIKM